MRIALGSSRNAQSGNWFVSTSPITLAVGEGWRSLTFPIDAGSLTQVSGTLDYAQFITQVGAIRILSSASTGNQGDVAAAVFGVDNVRAVPEGATLAGAALAAALSLARRRSRQTR
jgi:hypothetical protein